MSVSTPAAVITPHTNPNHTETYENFILILEFYKTKICDRKECRYFKQKFTETDPLLQNECIYSHSKADFRRPAFTPSSNKKAKNILNYSQYFTPEFSKTQITKSTNEKHCLNDYEYLYHPLNYKTKPCEQFQAGNCKSPFCVYFHSPEEEQFFENYRKKFDQTVNVFPFVDDIQKCLIRLNNVLKKPEEQQPPRARSVTPERSPKNSATVPIPVNQIVAPKGKSNEDYYILDQSVKFIEDHYHEFKFKLHIDTVMRYICGFLNSKGGILYFGINNDGVIKGTEMKEPDIAVFKKKLYESLKKFVPPVSEDEVKTNFCPVYKKDKEQGMSLVPNLYIVEFVVKKPAKSDIYFTNNKECYVKRSASTNLLKTNEIREYVKASITKRNNIILEKLESQLNYYEGRKLDELNPQNLEDLEKKLQSSLKIVYAALEAKK